MILAMGISFMTPPDVLVVSVLSFQKIAIIVTTIFHLRPKYDEDFSCNTIDPDFFSLGRALTSFSISSLVGGSIISRFFSSMIFLVIRLRAQVLSTSRVATLGSDLKRVE